ncbi:MAG: efflux RND transporter periplasmic adaptor subunit [Planctomycetota bacterium]
MTYSKTSEENVAKSDLLDQTIGQLKELHVGSRSDLKISRHLFRGVPSYVVHDPLNFHSHRFSMADYQVLSNLCEEHTLAESYQLLRSRGVVADDEKAFYQFILELQTKGLLSLPVSDGKRLFQRYKKRIQKNNQFSINKLIFLKIPVCNPNSFLDNTVHLFRPLFSKACFVFWAILMTVGIGLIGYQWDEFYAPLSDLLATRNLLILFVVLTALKLWHELGHAYACKIRGGAVPDMGAILMAGMPMAYVDVSSSWSFSSKRDRMIVALGGMYFETLAAGLAVILWSVSGPGVIKSTAHFVVIMAGLITLLFNINPLMRYDGYYVLSDLLGIPNLRSRSTQYINGWTKSLSLGTQLDVPRKSGTEMIVMIVYGIASRIYQVWLVLSISFLIASQYYLLGMVMGISFATTAILIPLKKTFEYLWFSPEIAAIRRRAVAVSGAIIACILAACTVLPVPGGVVAKGQVTFENLQLVRVPFDARVEEIHVSSGDQVAANQPLITVSTTEISDAFQLAKANIKLLEKEVMVAAAANSSNLQKSAQVKLASAIQQLQVAQTNHQKLTPTSQLDGVVLNQLKERQIGTFQQAGTELARVGSGHRIVRVLCSDRQFTSSLPKIGDSVQVRPNSTCSRAVYGMVARIEPAENRKIEFMALTQLAGGDVLVDPNTGEALQSSYLIIDIHFDSELPETIANESTASVRFGRRFETIGSYGFRQFNIFINQLFSK